MIAGRQTQRPTTHARTVMGPTAHELDGMSSDDIAKKIMNILDASDDGSKAPIAQNSIDMKIDDLCTLELANTLMSFMKSNNPRSPSELSPAYQECCHQVMLMVDEEKKKTWQQRQNLAEEEARADLEYDPRMEKREQRYRYATRMSLTWRTCA